MSLAYRKALMQIRSQWCKTISSFMAANAKDKVTDPKLDIC